MTIRVTQVTKSFIVKVKEPIRLNIQVTGEASSVAGSLTDLNDFDPSGVQNNYIVMYNASLQKYVTVDPDVVLSVSASGNTFPEDFLNRLDVDLDNRIDLDAGTF